MYHRICIRILEVTDFFRHDWYKLCFALLFEVRIEISFKFDFFYAQRLQHEYAPIRTPHKMSLTDPNYNIDVPDNIDVNGAL